MTRLIIVLATFGGVAFAATCFAGLKADEVASVTYANGTTVANVAGSMAATRATPDGFAKIGCWEIGNAFGITSYCLATDPNNLSLGCSSTSANIAQIIQAVTPTSHIAFSVGTDGSCEEIVIDDGSLFGSKK